MRRGIVGKDRQLPERELWTNRGIVERRTIRRGHTITGERGIVGEVENYKRIRELRGGKENRAQDRTVGARRTMKAALWKL